MQSLSKPKVNGLLRSVVPSLVVLALILGSGGCRNRSHTVERIAEDSAAAQEIESSLTFNNVTLEQADDHGQPLWKVHANQVTYSQDEQVAQVNKPKGELFQDGKPAFRVQAQEGEVRQDGEKIILQGQVIATDIRSGALLRGDEMEWTPEDSTLIIRKNVVGTHPQLRLAAREARLVNRQRRLELVGQVVATTKDPDMQLQGERLAWLIDQKRVVSDRPIRVDRLDNGQVIARASGQQAEVHLETKVATLKQNAELDLQDPPVRITGNSLIWNTANETVVADQPVSMTHRQQRVTLTANQGRMNVKQNVAYLTGNVRAIGQRNQSRLNSDRLTWTIPTQEIVAEGNVDYRQNNPLLTMRGPRAVGKLENQTVVVSGGRVVTEIIPE
jgi:LPS export ABC transporter protein LptC